MLIPCCDSEASGDQENGTLRPTSVHGSGAMLRFVGSLHRLLQQWRTLRRMA